MVILCIGDINWEVVAAIILIVALVVLGIIWFVKSVRRFIRSGAEERKLDKDIRMAKKTLELKNLKKDLEE